MKLVVRPSRREFELYLRENFCLSRRATKKVAARLFEGDINVNPITVMMTVHEIGSESLEKIDWEMHSGHEMHKEKLVCVVCENSFVAEVRTIVGRRNIRARVCSERCWQIERGAAIELSRKRKVTLDQALNLIICQTIRRVSNERTNKANHGRTAGNLVQGA